MSWFALLTLGGWITTVVVALLARTRQFAIFAGVLLGLYSLSALAMTRVPLFHAMLPLFAALHVSVYVNFVALTRPRMRPFAYRLLISWPGSFFLAGTLLAMPWAAAVALGFLPWVPWLPYALGAVGLFQSLTTKREEIDLVVRDIAVPEAAPKPHPRGAARETRPLRIAQISDPHLGPFMSVARLRRIAQRVVDAAPDLVFLTGDFLTMESQGDPTLLLDAMAPFRDPSMQGRVFACFGNHDHEAPRIVVDAMEANGITLLIDDARVVETAGGPVQIVGMDFTWRDRAAHLARVCAEHPRLAGAMRIVLLHDPGAFRHLPAGEADLVLSGHTHGGQVGLLSIGMAWTFLRLFGLRIPDHGFWARGSDRLWVHRGTGHYGFPLRLGVPAEESVLRIHRADAADAAR